MSNKRVEAYCSEHMYMPPVDNIEVCVLMATYQGERYIREQINSIRNQTYENWLLVVCDDGSMDGTLQALREYEHDDRVMLIEKTDKRQGAKENFSRLLVWALENMRVDLYMFCDQDDVWAAHKIECLVRKYLEISNPLKEDIPVLIHSDLTVVDAELQCLDESYYRYQGIKVGGDQCIETILTQNNITGCASAFNAKLASIASPIPEDAIWHDWWLGLVAACCGETYYVPDALVLYRQSGVNTVGAREHKTRNEYDVISWYEKLHTRNRYLIDTQYQAHALIMRINERQPSVLPDVLCAISEYSSFFSLPRRVRIAVWFRHRFGRAGWLGKVKFLMRACIISEKAYAKH